jgi:transposase
MNEIIQLNWAPHSPDMNPIENVWSIWKAGCRKVMRDPSQQPHGREEVIAIAQWLWEELQIYRWIDGMPRRVCTLLCKNGGPTQW